ncbi:MAG: hypothetical protein ABR562_03495 [Thermoplasmatota archaeon]
MTSVPSWAMSHLDANLPAGNPVVNAHAVRRNLILANTRLGAVLVRRGLFSGVDHVFLEVPSQKTAFQCGNCREHLQFYNLDIPNDVYCSICAAKYHVDEAGLVTDGDGGTVPAEFKPKQLHPFPPLWDAADAVRDVEPRKARGKAPRVPRTSGRNAKRASAPKAVKTVKAADAPFRHKAYTLYARETQTKGGGHVLYFFSKGEPKSGRPSALPAGYELGANSRTGLPFLRRAAPAVAADETVAPVGRSRKGRSRRSRRA